MTSYTPKLDLVKQDTGAQGWGTVLNQNFDKIDAGFGEIGVKNYSSTVTYASGEFVIASVGDQVGLYKSLQGNNVGHALTDTAWWEAVPLGGSGAGGFEICDIGIALGIDETENKRRYLNGQVISQAQFESFTDKLKSIVTLYPNLATTEVNWQAEVTNSKLGQCGKFVIDDVAGTIRLPKVVNINGLQNLAVLGGIKAESLPNIKGDTGGARGGSDINVKTGAFSGTGVSSAVTVNAINSSSATGLNFDASLSSSVYQDDAPVQQEAIQYPYFIQVATGVETSIDVSREIELTNPFTLFQYQFTDHILNNASWLRADTFSWQSGAVYVSAYEHLVADIANITAETETIGGYTVTFYRAIDGHKICLADQETIVNNIFTTTGAAWYYILDTENERFKLPRELPFDGQAKGNGKTLSLTSGDKNFGLQVFSGNNLTCVNVSEPAYGTDAGSAYTSATAQNKRLGVTTDPTKSGIILNRDNTDSQKYLYFYVGETIQDANLINAGAVLDSLANKVDSDSPHVVETYVNGSSWYRVYSDGWCEQGGIINVNYAQKTVDVILLKQYANVDYSVLLTAGGYTANGVLNDSWQDKTTSQFTIYGDYTNSTASNVPTTWQTRGYIS